MPRATTTTGCNWRYGWRIVNVPGSIAAFGTTSSNAIVLVSPLTNVGVKSSPGFPGVRLSSIRLAMADGQLVQPYQPVVTIATPVLDSLGSLAIAEVKKNGVFVVPGLGRLVRVDRKARMGRNPATGEAIKIPAKTVVKARIAKQLKDAVLPRK